jgi:hypothetical protein
VHLGLREMDGIGVMDTVAVTALHTEMLVHAYARAGLRTGRRWRHPRVPSDVQRLLETPR